MYIYTVHSMLGHKAEFVGDTSIKYRIKRENTSVPAKHKDRTAVIRADLDYDIAIAQTKSFNDKEREAQIIRNEEKHQLHA
jgi:hypothetical protein